MMKKRIMSIALALLMVLALLPFGALAAEGENVEVLASGSCGDSATYTITSDGVLTISGSGEVKSTKGVTRSPFGENPTYQKVVIEEGITAIGYGAFNSNDYIQEVVFPGSLRTIGSEAFRGCHGLKSIPFNEGLETIKGNAFSYSGLSGELVLPESVISIGESAFESTAVTAALVYGKVGFGVFRSCKQLETVVVMNSPSLGGEAFRECSKLKNVVLADTITSIQSGAFNSCGSLESIRIPKNVKEIPEQTFFMCQALKSVIMPPLKTINADAFVFCNALTEIYFAGTEAQLKAMNVHQNGNDPLFNANIYLIPGMPDPFYGFFDRPDPSSWAYEGIAFCLDNGFMNGMGDGYFQPGGVTTRAQLVTILWRMCGEPKPTQKIPFTDCNIAWAKDAIAWAAENNIVNGIGKGLFNPNGPITREQLVTVFYRFCREYLQMDVSASQSLSKFPDAAKVSSWAKDGMQWGTAVGLISGVGTKTGTELQPKGSATRAQIARVIMNFCTNVAPQD